ncbi:hypothetical protein CNY89_23025, partial [Amaricoccus sp. HAR-UPW-R2A-40]
MSQDAQTSLAVLLLDIKDEIDAAKAERRHVLDALQRTRISELDRAFASLSKAEDFERDSRLHYRQRSRNSGDGAGGPCGLPARERPWARSWGPSCSSGV